jgi:hypothetical protein
MFIAKSAQKSFLILSSLILVSGCSSIIEGRSQEIVVNTNPSGATCSLIRNSMPIGTVSPTPSAVLIEKTKYDIVIKCNKDGYQEATYFNKSGSAGATFGNIVAGGLIGWGIDSATGADNKYDSPVNISLVPIEYAEVDEAVTVTPKTEKIHKHKKIVATKKPAPPTIVAKSKENAVQTTAPIQTVPELEATESDYPTGRR